MRTIKLHQDYALVLQHVEENGEEDFTNLVESIQLDSKRLVHVLQALRHKGLIKMNMTAQDTWITLSSKGKRLMAVIWPEPTHRYTHAY
jgi:predicted transcriptional regulator